MSDITSTLRESRPRPRILRLTPWLAGAWALTFLALAAMALLGRAPHPWRPNIDSVLGALTPAQASGVLAVLAIGTLTAKVAAVAGRSPAILRFAGWTLVVVGVMVAVLIAGVAALAFLGYLPIMVLAAWDVGPATGRVTTELLLSNVAPLAHALGGVAITTTGVLTLDTARRREGRDGIDWRPWARWTRPAVLVAVVIPLLYALTRLAWVVGIPLGVRQEMIDDLASGRYSALGLALAACFGAWLTTGLVSRWGEVFFSWLPWLGGRPVPVALALVPGLFAAATVTSAGLSFWALGVTGELGMLPGSVMDDWAAWAPEMLWPFWGIALAVACLGYLGRRRA